MVRCGGGVGWVKCRRKCARDGSWVWLREGDVYYVYGVGWVRCARKCARDGALVWLWEGDGALRLRRRLVDGGRFVRKRVSEFIGTYQKLPKEIGLVQLSSDGLQ